VGKDQEQHLEMVRNFAKRFNHRYAEVFPEPVAFNFSNDLIRIPSLDGNGKMSKSENSMATLYLADDDETIRKKVMKIQTDSGPSEKNSAKPEYIQNLFLFMTLVSSDETVAKYEAAFNNCTIRYGDMKKQLAEDMVSFIAPIRKRVNEILNDQTYLKNVMRAGAEKAIASAEATMQIVRNSMSLDYF
jgi:tryptophanyl-tRNA synthetase